MAEAVALLIPLIILVLIGLAIVKATTATRQRHRQQWMTAAAHLGLQYNRGRRAHEHIMAGRVDGFAVRVDVEAGGRGGSDGLTTRYSAEYPNSRVPPIILNKQSPLHLNVVKKVLGKTDITIGDQRFDDRVLIDAADPLVAGQYLTPLRREAVLHLFDQKQLFDAQISNASISLRTMGQETSAESLVGIVQGMISTAKTMSAPTEGEVHPAAQVLPPAPVTPPPTPQDVVNLSDTPPASSAAPTPPPPAPPKLPTEPDPRPLDPEASAAEPEPITDGPEPAAAEPEHEVEVEVEVEAPDGVDLTQKAVIADLLGSDRMGFDIDERFSNAYANKAVHWTGTVDTVRDFRNDPDFDGTGKRISILLGSVDDSPFLSNRVMAVIAMSADARIERGQELSFSGELLRLDRFTKQLILSNVSSH